LPCFDRRAERQGVDYSASLAVMGHGCWNVDGEAVQAMREVARVTLADAQEVTS
jgi:hypothetical protein